MAGPPVPTLAMWTSSTTSKRRCPEGRPAHSSFPGAKPTPDENRSRRRVERRLDVQCRGWLPRPRSGRCTTLHGHAGTDRAANRLEMMPTRRGDHENVDALVLEAAIDQRRSPRAQVSARPSSSSGGIDVGKHDVERRDLPVRICRAARAPTAPAPRMPIRAPIERVSRPRVRATRRTAAARLRTLAPAGSPRWPQRSTSPADIRRKQPHTPRLSLRRSGGGDQGPTATSASREPGHLDRAEALAEHHPRPEHRHRGEQRR